MRFCGRNVQASEALIWLGVVLGNLDWVTDVVYHAQAKFGSDDLRRAQLAFILLQPMWYAFMYIVYIATHKAIETRAERSEKMCLSLPYAVLQQLKLLGSFEKTNLIIFEKFLQRDQYEMFNLENSYRVQMVVEATVASVPQLAIQIANNNATAWDDRAVRLTSMVVGALVLLKNLIIVSVFATRRYCLKKKKVQMRPRGYQTLQSVPKVDRLSMASMKAYLQDNSIEQVDAHGGSRLHQLVLSEKTETLEEMALEKPQQLFMLNKLGQTPLDICIEDDSASANLDATKDQEELQEQFKMYASNSSNSKNTKAKMTTKVVDEAQTLHLIQKENAKVSAEMKYFEWMKKAVTLMRLMDKFQATCSIRMLKFPNRLELKYARSFTMAVKKGRTTLFEEFPKKSIKTVFVSTSQLQDIRQFKAQRKDLDQDVITTPLHLACQMSNVEAARILLMNHDYDVNILLYEKNFLYDLLNTGGFEDFSILTSIFKQRKPCVNSGCKMPINQAILRGNQYIIQTMLEHGQPNPYAKDEKGITPLHTACATLDWETFEELINKGGDPMLPDKDGNTFLHLLCQGVVKDIEYDFAKLALQSFNIKLTRNSRGKTPLDILRSTAGAAAGFVRGQPNYKRRLQDYLDNMHARDPAFVDHEANSDFHNAIIRDMPDQFEQICNSPDFVKCELNLRNCDGKSPVMLAIEHGRQDFFNKLCDGFAEHIDFTVKDTFHGNTALHIACLQENISAVEAIYRQNPELCMLPNFLGRSPFFCACQRRNMELLEIFREKKHIAIEVRDYLGENMLFVCARSGDVEMFQWFAGSNNFFKARGQQNYKGQTIEHVVCMEGHTALVQDIRPKLNTQDYYGNLPIHYTIAKDDVEMIESYYQKRDIRAYFEIRNFKYETIFHIAAKHNSFESLDALLGKPKQIIFLEELLKRDFKGDTPLHTAARTGSREVLELFLTACTPVFLELQNDFGQTPRDAMEQKLEMIQDKLKDRSLSGEEKEKIYKKLERIQEVEALFEDFDRFVDEKTWNKRFEISLQMYLDRLVDPCMRLFIGLEAQGLPIEEIESEVDVELVDLEKDRDQVYSAEDSKGDKERQSLIEKVDEAP